MRPVKQFILSDLPKVSLNDFYSGGHWGSRKKLKDWYKLLVNSQIKETLPFFNDTKKIYYVEFNFEFKRNPLDWDNCAGMSKMIQDCLFKQDGFKQIRKGSVSSNKGMRDIVMINVFEII